ncbi:GmrSD restriction endonuclease domain-containing protein [Glycomyces tritici]|nr:DUF262 domain-containing protein [Glycomyces tritici]
MDQIHQGKLQLPDFQRDWVWPVDNIIRLIASISKGFPIGSIMTMVTGGEVKFAERPIEGAPASGARAQSLILDGQQRLTSLYQSLCLGRPVQAQDHKKKRRDGWLYIDMRKALTPEFPREDAIRFIGADRKVRDFRGETIEDYSTPEAEYEAFLFPLNQVFDSDAWEDGFRDYYEDRADRKVFTDRLKDFRNKVLAVIRGYQVPLIELKQEAEREAVCQVFENVNTGAVPLNVFELLTATYAAASFDLRSHWSACRRELSDPLVHRLLTDVSSTDFIQAVTLLSTMERNAEALRGGIDAANAPRVGCRRIDMLDLGMDDYQRFAPRVVEGLKTAARFLFSQKLFEAKYLPYGSQLIPLAAIFAQLGEDAESSQAQAKISQWYWCGVFGELYGGSTETRFAADLPEVVAWVRGGSKRPRTVDESQFASSRLSTLRTRNSAAYKGLYAQLLAAGATDWRTGKAVDVDTYFGESLDIHHIFPKRWCEERGIDPKVYNGISNKTPLSSRTNRKVGGNAPSKYLPTLGPESVVDEALRSSLVDPVLLRADDFERFMSVRKEALLRIIEQGTGKPCYRDEVGAVDDVDDAMDDTDDE